MPYTNVAHQDISPFETNQLISFVKAIGRPIGLITIILGFLQLLGYFFEIEFLYRPIEGGPATNPLTALIVSLIAFSFEFKTQRIHSYFPLFLSLLALFLSMIHCYCILSKAGISKHFTPFYSVVASDIASGKDNSMGLNTTIMLLMLITSHLMYHVKQFIISQFFAFTALCLPMVSILGYLYGMPFFYGHMSLLSTIFGVFLCVSALAVTADKGGVKALLSPFVGGKVARLQMVFGSLVPFLAGFWVIQSLETSDQNMAFGMYVVATCWFIVLLVIMSAILQEKADILRREREKALHYSATTDALTSLPNRFTFMKKAERLQAGVSKDYDSTWCLMLDIDHFKRVNDTAGHLIGDKVLITFANELKRFIRAEDLVCRFGGEEFAILLTNMRRDQVAEVAERIREAISKVKVNGYTEQFGQVTVSIGCAHLDKDTDVSHGIKLADMALYHAKETGRNKVSFNDSLLLAE